MEPSTGSVRVEMPSLELRAGPEVRFHVGAIGVKEAFIDENPAAITAGIGRLSVLGHENAWPQLDPAIEI